VDFSISGQDIQDNVINQNKLADASVGTDELQDNAVTESKIDLVDITLSDFVNDVPFLEAADLVAADVTYDNVASGLTAANVQDAIDALDTNLDVIALVPLGDGTYEFTDGAGNRTVVNTNGLTISGTIAGNPIALLTRADSSSEVINETITSLSDNGDGTITFTGEDGLPQTVAKADLTAAGPGLYTFTNNDGSDVSFDLNAAALPFDNGTNGFTADSVQEAIEEVQNGSSDDQNLTGLPLDATNTLQIDIEDGSPAIVDLSPLRQNLTDVLAQGNDAGGVLIRNVLDPELAQDAATRAFVEGAISDLVVSGGGDAPNEYNESFAVEGDSLVIRDAQTSYAVGLNEIDTNTTNSTLTQNGIALILTDSEGNTVDIALADLAGVIDTNTTNASLTLDATNLVLTDSEGATVVLPLADLAGAIDTNTTNTAFAVVATDLVITESDGGQVSIPLAEIASLTDTDTNSTNTAFSVIGTDLVITDSDGGQVSVALADIAALTDTDTNTQLSEAEVVTFVANNGFITTVQTDGVTILGDGVGTPLFIGEISGGADGNIAANSITQGDIDTDAVGNGELRDNSVGESELQDEAVTPAKIEPGANGEVLTTTGGVVSWSAPAVKAWGKIAGGGGSPLGGTGIANVTADSPNTGDYTIDFITPLQGADYTIQLTVQGDYRIWVENQTATNCVIRIEDSAGAPGSAIFFITILE
jgi:hypothetical protein